MTVEEMIAKEKKSVKSIELTQSIELLSLNKREEKTKSPRDLLCPIPTSSSLPPGAEVLL